MDITHVIITVLVGLLGMAVGGLGIYRPIARKQTESCVQIAEQARDIKTVFRDIESNRNDIRGTIALMRKIVDQNNLLIQKVTVGGH